MPMAACGAATSSRLARGCAARRLWLDYRFALRGGGGQQMRGALAAQRSVGLACYIDASVIKKKTGGGGGGVSGGGGGAGALTARRRMGAAMYAGDTNGSGSTQRVRPDHACSINSSAV